LSADIYLGGVAARQISLEQKKPNTWNPTRRVGIEFRKARARWERDGLIAKYLSGQNILDLGFRGGDPEAVPITENAIGIEVGYPGYDGTNLPFGDGTQDTVFASAVFEHIPNYREVLREWYRVVKVGGHILIFVPHRHLYEKRPDLPSKWNGDHRRFYTSASLLREIEESLPVNGFRIRHLLEDDDGYRYDHDQGAVPAGCYQIEGVIQKIAAPAYSERLEYRLPVREAVAYFDRMIIGLVAAVVADPTARDTVEPLFAKIGYFTPWHRLTAYFVYSEPAELQGTRLSLAQLKATVRPWLDLVDVDEAAYLRQYPQLKDVRNLALHWRLHGYFEGRLGSKFDFAPGC